MQETVQNFKTIIIHPSTMPISNAKPKQVSKLYHVLCNNRSGENTTPKYQLITESMRKFCTLLDYVHMTTHNHINVKSPLVPII